MSPIQIAEFRIETQIQTDAGGTEIIGVDLRGPVFCTTSYVQNPLGFKGDGVWRDSPLANFRELADAKHANLLDSITMDINGGDPDAATEAEQTLYRLCMLAVYYANGWSPFPVWIRLRPAHMSEAQYAIFHMFRLPRSTDPFVGPFVPNADGTSTIHNFEVTIEHGAWRDTRPIDQGECVELAGYGAMCYPCHIEFNGTTTSIVVPDNAVIQDLHDAAFTVESYIRADDWGENDRGHIARKGPGAANGWVFLLNDGRLQGVINCAVAAGDAIGTADLSDGVWVHVAMTWDDAVDLFPRLWIGGVEATYSATVNRNGVIDTDVGDDLYIGNRIGGDRTFDGGIGWTRISNVVRYDKTFEPPPRCALPEIDPLTIGLWIGAECSGAMPVTIDNIEGTAAIDGTLTAGEFCCDCGRWLGNVLPFCGPAFLEFNGDMSIVTVPDAASIQDLHDAALTVEAYIRADSWGGAGGGQIATKQNNAGVGWTLELGGGGGGVIRARIDCAVADGIAQGLFTVPSVDHVHVAMTFDDAVDLFPRLWVGGVEVAYSVTANRNGAVVSDIGQDLTIGNSSAGTLAFDGDISWIRISDVIRYSATFDPPERCALPAKDGNTILLEIWEGFGATTFDLSGNRNDGAIDAATWGCDCLDDDESSDRGELDPDPTCAAEAYLANKWDRINLTHIYWYDGSLALWGPNLAEAAPPFELFPDPVGDDDFLYFCASTESVHGGPFFSLVLDLFAGTGFANSGAWEYWDGGWTAVLPRDHTLGLSVLGDNSVHWLNESGPGTAWVTTTINGVTGWWFRYNVANSGSWTGIPIQQNRQIYSISWPWVEVEADQVGGDIPALAEELFLNVSDGTTLSSDTQIPLNRAVMGLRSLRRGLTFTPAINPYPVQTNYAQGAGDTGPHMPTGFRFGAWSGGTLSFVASSESVTGYYLLVAAAAVSAAYQWLIDGSYVTHYYGRFHVYVRVSQPTGPAGDYGVFVVFNVGSGGFGSVTKTAYTQSNQSFEILDCGRLQIGSPDIMLPDDIGDQGTLSIGVVGDAAGTGLRIYDVWLIPVDEWAADIVDVTLISDSALGYVNGFDRYLQVDGTRRTKRKRALVRQTDDDISSSYLMQAVQRPIFQSETLQRLHCLWMQYSSGAWVAPPWAAVSAQAYKVQRYNLLRGSK